MLLKWIRCRAVDVDADAVDGTRITVTPKAETLIRRLDALPEPPRDSQTFPGHDAIVDGLLTQPAPQISGLTAAWSARRRNQIRNAVKSSVRWRSVHEIAMRERVRGRTDGSVGREGGQLVHEVMEHLDLAKPKPPLEGLVRAFRPAGMADETAETCLGILQRILDHEVIQRARAAPERWQEVPFTYQDRGRQVSGTIDLCFPSDPGRKHWVVVDWKSDVPPTGTPAHRNFGRQLQTYAKASIATVTPCEEVETLLVGPYPELGAPDLGEGAMAEVAGPLKAVLERLLAAGVPAPRVGADIGTPMVMAEMAWIDRQICVLLDGHDGEVGALEEEGWTVYSADTSGLTWAEAIEEWVGTVCPRE